MGLCLGDKPMSLNRDMGIRLGLFGEEVEVD
jgi:hypothetical protein